MLRSVSRGSGNGNTVFSFPPLDQIFPYTPYRLLKRFILAQKIFNLDNRLTRSLQGSV
jgi:hypothetical protein